MNAIERVLRAWTDPGPVPVYHRNAQDALRRDWPVLANALDELARTLGSEGAET